MAAECQALCGRTGDTVLITTGQLAIWFNEAQRMIVRECPGLHCMGFKNTASVDFTDKVAYPLADFTLDATTQTVANVFNVFYLDGLDSCRLSFVHTDEFDAQWIDPTHTDAARGKPRWWTRREAAIEIVPLCSSSYYDKGLRVDGDFYATDFTSGDSTVYGDICEADEGLKYYALSKSWRAMGQTAKAIDYSQQFDLWLDGYQHQNDRLLEWDGNLFSDDLV